MTTENYLNQAISAIDEIIASGVKINFNHARGLAKARKTLALIAEEREEIAQAQ